MRVKAVLSCIIIYALSIYVEAFAPSLNSRPTTYTTLGLFGNIFKANEQSKGEKSIGNSGSSNSSFKKQLDGMMKKKKFSVLMICSSAKDCIKGESCIICIWNTYHDLALVKIKLISTILLKLHGRNMIIMSKKKSFLMTSLSNTWVRQSC